MILLFGMLCLGFAAATLCPASPLGRIARRVLIEAPAEGLSAKGLGKLGVRTIVLVALLAIVAAPELLAVVVVADLTLYVEVVGLALLLGAADHVKGAAFGVVKVAKTALRPVMALRRRGVGRAPAAPSAPRRTRKRTPDPDPGWAFA